ncbi:MAG: VWA domain-containing protein, partial [Armatimonadota bacterium]
MYVDRLTGFAQLCRAYGVDVSPSEVAAFVRDVCMLDLEDAQLFEETAVGAIARDTRTEGIVRKLFRLYFHGQCTGNTEPSTEEAGMAGNGSIDMDGLPEPARSLLTQAQELGLAGRREHADRGRPDRSPQNDRPSFSGQQAEQDHGRTGQQGRAQLEGSECIGGSAAGMQAGSDGGDGEGERGERGLRGQQGKTGQGCGRRGDAHGQGERLAQKLADACAELVAEGEMPPDVPAVLAAMLEGGLARSFAHRLAAGLGASFSPAKKARIQEAVAKLAARLLAEGLIHAEDAARLTSLADDDLRLGIVVSGSGFRSALHDAEALAALLERYRNHRQLLPALAAKLADALRYMMTKPSPQLEPSDLGRLDVRATIQASLAYGGVPLEFRYRRRREEHEVVLALDVSGSQRAWAASAVICAYALGRLLSRLHGFTFTADVNDVTRELRQPERFIERLNDFGGFSNYLTALTQLEQRAVLGRRTILVLVGDCRDAQGTWVKQSQGRYTRYIEPKSAGVMKRLVRRCRRVLVLNPEHESRWSSGD